MNARFWRRVRKLLKRRRIVVVVAVLLGIGIGMNGNKPDPIDPSAYAPLLATIARGESGGNYNAYFGSPANSTIRFTDMTVAEVLAWQEDYVRRGSISNAVGKYQIIRPTLVGLVNQLGIDATERFDENLQDRLAIALLERRGSVDYVNSKLSREDFAANLAKEWAALPKVLGPNPHDSYYASDGINKSRVSVDEVYSALALLKNSSPM